jgi:DNA-binding response OmpR family regulator
MDSCKKILVADDEEIHLEFFEVMLSKCGYVVETAGDGVQALDKIKKFRPDLIILDNIMPKMSGWEVTRTLKSSPKFREIPIIMISALDDEKDKAAVFDVGVDDYITKPFDFAVVLARINAVMRNRELFVQIALRESRLALAEELNRGIKENLAALAGIINGLDNAGGEKIQAVRKQIANMDARIEKTCKEWDNMKKDEIGLSVLESRIREALHQEQR